MRHILIIVLCFAFSKNINAQPNGEVTISNYQQIAQRETDRTNTTLSLSVSQKDSVQRINERYYYKIATIRSVPPADRTIQLASNKQERRSRLQLQLTTEQFAAYYAQLGALQSSWQHRLDSVQAARRRAGN